MLTPEGKPDSRRALELKKRLNEMKYQLEQFLILNIRKDPPYSTPVSRKCNLSVFDFSDGSIQYESYITTVAVKV